MRSLALGHLGAFLSHRAFHNKHQERGRKRQRRDHPKDVEIGKRRCLLLAHIFELLPSQLLQRDRIGGLLEEERLSLCEEGFGGCVEGIEILAKPQRVELITPLLESLRQRRPDAAALVAQKAQQTNGG